ncbi:hypothetical protein D3C87_1860140 [compost metagenome]
MPPSLVILLPARAATRLFIGSGTLGELRRSKRNCTALATLLTFCPPGPDARTKLSSISAGSIATERVM